MSTMFALVLTVSMLTGGNQDVLLGVYDTENDCKAAAEEQHVKAECYPLKGLLDEHPAGFTKASGKHPVVPPGEPASTERKRVLL